MSGLSDLLDSFRKASLTELEKGTYFEELMVHYFKSESLYQDLNQEVWLYSEWAEQQQLARKNDTGIDLVAQTRGTNEFHAIQCKNYAENHRLQKSDIDSFFTASGKTSFSQRTIDSTTNDWSVDAQDELIDQHPPVSVITLADLEYSQIDWAKYQSTHEVLLKDKKQLCEHQTNALNTAQSGFVSADRGKLIMACGTAISHNR